MPRLTPEQLIDQLYGPPPSSSQKKLEDFKKKNIPKPDKPKSLDHELFEQIDLDIQYQEELQRLTHLNLLKELSNHEQGIVGIDNQEYPIPTLDQIKEQILKNPEILHTKYEQGFTKLLIVPFALNLQDLVNSYQQTIKDKHLSHNLKSTTNETLELDENEPIWVWEGYTNQQLVYFPQEYSLNHQGKTKEQLLQQNPQNAWQILLVEDLPDLPAENQAKTINHRKQLQANSTPQEYLNLLNTDSQYQHEQGLTPEAYLTYAQKHLQQTNQVIDDWQGQGKACWLLGAYFPESNDVPFARWRRDYRQASLCGSDSDSRDERSGARPAVSIFDL